MNNGMLFVVILGVGFTLYYILKVLFR